MTHFGGFNSNGDARRAHLALVGGTGTDLTSASREAAAVLRPVANVHRANSAMTAYGAASGLEAPRSRHESGVRAVARDSADFESALLPMVLASGVSGESATAIRNAILNNPALKAEAERAFQRARIESV
ncbi:MAG: hypothetical protein JWM90_804 [Thermoleophilia bacterium]|nr:hypothetical protein [Thermoleophilia bacterium]